MAAQHISQADFEEKVLKSTLPVMVDFFTTWCGPCQMAAPILDQLADEYSDKVTILKLNTDENHEVSAKYGVMSIPTVIGFKNGQEVERKIGYGGKQGYIELLDKVLEHKS